MLPPKTHLPYPPSSHLLKQELRAQPPHVLGQLTLRNEGEGRKTDGQSGAEGRPDDEGGEATGDICVVQAVIAACAQRNSEPLTFAAVTSVERYTCWLVSAIRQMA